MAKLDRERYKTRRRIEVSICPNLELIDEHSRLDRQVQDELKEMREASKDSLVGHGRPPSADALAEVEARLDTERDVYVIEKVGQQRWIALQMAHPATDAAHRRLGYNPMTFPPAALAASCVEPELTDDDAEWLFAELDQAQWDKLWDAVLDVNLGRGDSPKSLTLAVLDQLSKTGSSGTASTTGSPPPTS